MMSTSYFSSQTRIGHHCLWHGDGRFGRVHRLIVVIFAAAAFVLTGHSVVRANSPACANFNKVEFYFEAGPSDIKRCLGDGRSVSERTRRGRTPLYFAASVYFRDSVDATGIKTLLAAGADPNSEVTGRNYMTAPLLNWARSGWPGKDRNHRRPQRSTRADAAVVRALLKGGADPNYRANPGKGVPGGRLPSIAGFLANSTYGKTWQIAARAGFASIHLAIASGKSEEAIEALLQYGAEPDAPVHGEEEWTALHIAAWTGKPGIIRLLLRYGADPKITTTSNHWTALHVLAKFGRYSAATGTLLKAGVDPKQKDKRGLTAWDLLQERFTSEEIRKLSADVRRDIALLKAATTR